MQEILAKCVELDTAAQKAYTALAAACPDPELQRTFERMASEEWAHVEWWRELQDSNSRGRVPTIADEKAMRSAIDETTERVASLLDTDVTTLTADEMLEYAVRFEFFMMDPAFGELIDLLDTGNARHHHDAYSRHVMRLVHELENRAERKGLTSFLARVLARAYEDHERLVTLATRDPLTQLYNRRGFYSYLLSWLAWSERYGHSLSVLLIDVDHFKSVNDTYGHPVGDEVLCAIAGALNEAVRSSDLVARYGGDEFAVLAPETSADAASFLAERILAHVQNAVFEIGDARLGLSVSVGAAYVPAGAAATPEQLLSCADISLYEAKDAGRARAGAPIDITLHEG
jgi:diguanylate cyclase (GGDEF)-like protein